MVREMEQAQNKGSERHITADKREIKDFPKLPSATSFIRKTLYEMANPVIEAIKWKLKE